MNIPKDKAHLAPMAGITNRAFRELCVNKGAGMTVTELASVQGIIKNQEKTFELIKKSPKEKHFCIQLFGSKPEDFAQASSIIDKDCNCIDINAGCPVPKVYSNGGGSALIKDPKHIGKIINAISSVSNTAISVKIRTGISSKQINALQTAKICEEQGANHITIHGRTKEQGYGGFANWDIIQTVATNITIPIIGNGDLKTVNEVIYAMDNYKVHSTAIGRGANGNPLLFEKIHESLKKRNNKKNNTTYDKENNTSYDENKNIETYKEKIDTIKEYIKLAKKYNISFTQQLIQAQHITKGIKGSNEFRSTLYNIKTSDKLLEAIELFFITASAKEEKL
jgi:tRNA-dihydrouridine synthase B